MDCGHGAEVKYSGGRVVVKSRGSRRCRESRNNGVWYCSYVMFTVVWIGLIAHTHKP